MSTITKEWLQQKIADMEATAMISRSDLKMEPIHWRRYVSHWQRSTLSL
jgi:hypothetical protein